MPLWKSETSATTKLKFVGCMIARPIPSKGTPGANSTRSSSYQRKATLKPRQLYRLQFDAADEPLAVGFGQRTFSRIVRQCRKEKKQTGSRSLLNTGMGLLPVSTLTPGHFGTVTGSPASLHANVKSKAVSSPVRSSACTPTGDANASHNPNSRVKLIAVAQPFDAFMLGAMDAAEDRVAVLHAMSDDAVAAIGAHWRERLDRAFK